MRDDLKQKILEYTAIFEPAEEGGYVVSIPALPGCATQGDTFEEAVANIKDATQGYLEVLKEGGQEIPQEKHAVVITKVIVTNPTISSL